MRARGFSLSLILMLSVLMLLLGLGFLNKRVSQYRGALQSSYSLLALQLAKAGLEDARVKLEKCGRFPLGATTDQKFFSYTEILEPDRESYTVTLDLALVDAPFSIIRITSVGTSGPISQPRARRCLKAELDVSEHLRSNSSLANPDFFQLVHWQDLGSL